MIWCLDFHAPYRCRHAGACCRAGWTIPFEDGTVAATEAGGGCTFLDVSARRCAIHRAGGLLALPVACRMFPRIVLHDARGTFVSLSHFCPTAAALLFDSAGEAAIVEAPPALADAGELDGLDARREWPPLLRSGVLMDPGSYGAWERRAVAVLARGPGPAADALAALEEITTRITAWMPGEGRLVDVVHASFDSHEPAADAADAHAAVRRWLAARLFGAWTAYQGDGLGATVAYLRGCLAIFDEEIAMDGSAREAVRRSDLRIVHTAGRTPGPRR